MSDTVLKPKFNIVSDHHNILNSVSNKRFNNFASQNQRHYKIFDNLSEYEQKQLLKDFKINYSLILFDYFSDKIIINEKIETFAKKAFGRC